MEYYLMHRDDVVTLCDFDENGRMLAWAKNIKAPELAPLDFRRFSDWLIRWWENRKIPLKQGRIETMLAERGFIGSGQYLLNNLGLSLTDHYWICPLDADLKWKDVNLFQNDFKEDLVSGEALSQACGSGSYTPNSTLKGELEKTWVIRNGRRQLIKGNHGKLSSESINEVIASEFHAAQGFSNHTGYSLLKIRNKPYDFGCVSDAFTSNELELVSAYGLITSEPAEDRSMYEHLIEVAGKYGLDKDALREDLEYQILSDYILSNTDRHMENIAFLRDTDSLQLVSMAPIFDSGRSLFANTVVAYTDEEFEDIETNSFEPTERGLLGLVRRRELLDMSRILSPDRVEELYSLDSKISGARVKAVRRAYEKKIERLSR